MHAFARQNRTKVGLKLGRVDEEDLAWAVAKSNQGGIETQCRYLYWQEVARAKSNQGGIETSSLLARVGQGAAAKSNQGGIETSILLSVAHSPLRQNRTKVGLKQRYMGGIMNYIRTAKSNQGGIETGNCLAPPFLVTGAKSNQGGIETAAILALSVKPVRQNRTKVGLKQEWRKFAHEAGKLAKSNQGGIETRSHSRIRRHHCPAKSNQGGIETISSSTGRQRSA